LRNTWDSSSKSFAFLSNVYIAGSIIFGGGPVVIPLLYSYVVDPGWLTEREFLIGVAFINVLPGPNFNFAGYCGALAFRNEYLILGAIMGWFGIFFPGLCLKMGILPLWKYVRGNSNMKSIFRGVNAAAVGLVFYAVWTLWQKAIVENGISNPLGNYPLYVIVCCVGFVGVEYLNSPACIAVAVGALVGLINYAVIK